MSASATASSAPVQLFQTCLVNELAPEAGVETLRARSSEEVCSTVAERVEGLRVLSWDPAVLPHQHLLGGVLEHPVLGAAPRADQANADVGVTGCDAAVAETRTLALLSGPGKARTVSLLRPAHLAVVRQADVLLTMGELPPDPGGSARRRHLVHLIGP